MPWSVDEERPQHIHVPLPLVMAMRSREVPLMAVALYVALDSYRDRSTRSCYPSLRTLAKDLGISVTSIARFISILEARGFVRKDRPENMKMPMVYVLLYAPPEKKQHVGNGVPPRGTRHPVYQSCTKSTRSIPSRVPIPKSISSLDPSSQKNQVNQRVHRALEETEFGKKYIAKHGRLPLT